ncbi:hypothetical protein O181_033413 [Austropuccinia psidii MF-1]|uniref:Uncharacterized protein n=1 Tax=Austropuccinia psidii MF-1 TaxID=1389203 RepID=A0A9Q3D1G4_9BASI|nr:hypothetical protein [Austropuccinia psidii MF-1]
MAKIIYCLRGVNLAPSIDPLVALKCLGSFHLSIVCPLRNTIIFPFWEFILLLPACSLWDQIGKMRHPSSETCLRLEKWAGCSQTELQVLDGAQKRADRLNMAWESIMASFFPPRIRLTSSAFSPPCHSTVLNVPSSYSNAWWAVPSIQKASQLVGSLHPQLCYVLTFLGSNAIVIGIIISTKNQLINLWLWLEFKTVARFNHQKLPVDKFLNQYSQNKLLIINASNILFILSIQDGQLTFTGRSA